MFWEVLFDSGFCFYSFSEGEQELYSQVVVFSSLELFLHILLSSLCVYLDYTSTHRGRSISNRLFNTSVDYCYHIVVHYLLFTVGFKHTIIITVLFCMWQQSTFKQLKLNQFLHINQVHISALKNLFYQCCGRMWFVGQTKSKIILFQIINGQLWFFHFPEYNTVASCILQDPYLSKKKVFLDVFLSHGKYQNENLLSH